MVDAKIFLITQMKKQKPREAEELAQAHISSRAGICTGICLQGPHFQLHTTQHPNRHGFWDKYYCPHFTGEETEAAASY